jgi:hypothetical protein
VLGPVTGSIVNSAPSARRRRRDQAINYFNSIGLDHELFSPVGTDAISFNNIGIPASGLLTGQDCCKSQAEATCSVDSSGTSKGTLRASTGDVSTTRSGGATTSATTIPRCSRSCRRRSPT